MEEDLPLESDSHSRSEILARLLLLGLNASSKSKISDLKVQLGNFTKMHHPIHKCMSQLTQE